MTKDLQSKIFKLFIQRMEDVLISKGEDYANNDDTLSNFKLAGSICQLTPEQQCLSLIATKVARLGVLLNKQSNPNNESISDSISDLANYTFLLETIIAENNLKRSLAKVGSLPNDNNKCKKL
jgi:hypothetical protein